MPGAAYITFGRPVQKRWALYQQKHRFAATTDSLQLFANTPSSSLLFEYHFALC
jgi:hypothetical protein